ncbi:UNVERIFIED_ORG: hypothetical protein QOE_3083 [Clostridioides difficile F501]
MAKRAESVLEKEARNVECAWERRWNRARSGRFSMVMRAMET